MMVPLLSLDIAFEDDLVAVRQRARQAAALLGFDEIDQARISTAVSEIARNALLYANGGRAEFALEAIRDPGYPYSLQIRVSDRGPGIADITGVLEGRTVSGGTPGIGIRSARRLVDSLEIDSAPGRGTAVVLGKRLQTCATLEEADLAAIRDELGRPALSDPYHEIRRQNRELVRTMEELRDRQEDLVRLNRELEETNRGVVALYAELDEKAVHLRRSDQLKTRFLSNMSHEFRTPLNSILALSRLLLDRVDGPLTDEQAKQLTFIQKSTRDLYSLVNDLLDIAKVEAGRVTMNPSETEVANVFAGLRGMFRPLLTNPAVELVFEEPADIPPMYTDEGKLSQILRNLISNALKFTEAGTVRVAAVYDEEPRQVVFSVADTGIGIAAEDFDRIFQEFGQVENPIQNRVRGTGLGLPLAKKLAELLGGGIAVTSRVGEGSVFTATIPLTYTGALASGEPGALAAADLTRYPVLIVENDPDSVALYTKYLKRTAFQPLIAGNLAEARSLIGHIRPIAVVLHPSPQSDATWDFLLELKRDEGKSAIPVFVTSAADEAAKARALGADEFWPMPLSRAQLLASLRELAHREPAQSVLIIDDDEVSRYLFRDLLADSRYAVLEASDGCTGIQIAHEHRPQAILLDLVMPKMSGLEVLEALAADPTTAEIPVVIVTSKTLDQSECAQLTARTAGILSKQLGSSERGAVALRELLGKAIVGSGRPRTGNASHVQ